MVFMWTRRSLICRVNNPWERPHALGIVSRRRYVTCEAARRALPSKTASKALDLCKQESSSNDFPKGIFLNPFSFWVVVW